MPEDNFRLVVGCWFYPKTTTANNVFSVKVNGSATRRVLFRTNGGNLQHIRETSPSVFDFQNVSDGAVDTNRLHKVIMSFRRVASGGTPDRLECVLVFYGYDANGNAQIFDENTVDGFGFDWDDLDWTSLRIGGGSIIIQNVQGFLLESTTPLLSFPRHSTLRDWEEHNSNQFDDYIWNNASVTNTAVERVVIEERVQFNNLLNLDHDVEEFLPEPLKALNNQAEVFNITHSNYRSNNAHVFLANTFAMLKNAPTTFPNTADVFANEIVGSQLTVDDPATVTSIQDVSTLTNNVMTGAGISGESFGVNNQDQNNWRLVLGGWLYYENLPTTFTPILRVRERAVTGSVSYRDVFGMDSNGLVFKRRDTTGTTTGFSITHHLYSDTGLIEPRATGTGANTITFRTYTAETFRVRLSAFTGESLQGGQAQDYVVSNVNTSQAATTLNFDLGLGEDQEAKVSYQSSSTLFGGAAHTVTVEIDAIVGNESSAVNEIQVELLAASSAVTTSTGNTFTDLTLSDGHVAPRRLMRYIASFRSADGLETGNLECVITFFGYDDNGNPRVFDENTLSLNYPSLDLRWDDFTINGAGGITQNVQGFFLNPDTPLFEFPLHSTLRGWLTSYDNKSDDWVWGNVHGPDQDTEAVHFPEFVNFDNFILVSPDGTKYKVSVANGGTLTTTQVT